MQNMLESCSIDIAAKMFMAKSQLRLVAYEQLSLEFKLESFGCIRGRTDEIVNPPCSV